MKQKRMLIVIFKVVFIYKMDYINLIMFRLNWIVFSTKITRTFLAYDRLILFSITRHATIPLHSILILIISH